MSDEQAVLRPTGAGSALRRWHERAADPDTVVLDGFHALKHALRFGADVHVAVSSDKDAVLRLAADLAPDLTADLAERVSEIPAAALRELVTRVHPTAVAALAARPARDGVRPRWPRCPGGRPSWSWTAPATSAMSGR